MQFALDTYKHAHDAGWMPTKEPGPHQMVNTDEVRRTPEGKFRSVLGFKRQNQHFRLVNYAGHNDPSNTVSIALSTWADGHPRHSPTIIMKVYGC